MGYTEASRHSSDRFGRTKRLLATTVTAGVVLAGPAADGHPSSNPSFSPKLTTISETIPLSPIQNTNKACTVPAPTSIEGYQKLLAHTNNADGGNSTTFNNEIIMTNGDNFNYPTALHNKITIMNNGCATEVYGRKSDGKLDSFIVPNKAEEANRVDFEWPLFARQVSPTEIEEYMVHNTYLPCQVPKPADTQCVTLQDHKDYLVGPLAWKTLGIDKVTIDMATPTPTPEGDPVEIHSELNDQILWGVTGLDVDGVTYLGGVKQPNPYVGGKTPYLAKEIDNKLLYWNGKDYTPDESAAKPIIDVANASSSLSEFPLPDGHYGIITPENETDGIVDFYRSSTKKPEGPFTLVGKETLSDSKGDMYCIYPFHAEDGTWDLTASSIKTQGIMLNNIPSRIKKDMGMIEPTSKEKMLSR